MELTYEFDEFMDGEEVAGVSFPHYTVTLKSCRSRSSKLIAGLEVTTGS